MSDSITRRSFLTTAAAAGTVAAVGAVASVGIVGCAQQNSSGSTGSNNGDSPGTNPDSGAQASKDTILEINITPFPNWHHGNPGIGIDPKNPNNMCLVCTSTTPWDNTWHFSMAQSVYYSTDRGDTWTQTDFPFGIYPGAGVATLTVDSDGLFYLHYNALRAPDPADDRYASRINPTLVSSSSDGGKTWSDPVETHYVVTGYPMSRVDKATGKYYVLGAKRGQWQLPVYVSVSSDKGKTFSEPKRFPFPKRVHPDNNFEGFPGNIMAVHAGILTSAHQESLTNPAVDEYCHFLVSRDDGDSWDSFPIQVKDAEGNLKPVPAADILLRNFGSGPRGYCEPLPLVTADPTKEGRFACLVPRDLGKANSNDLIGFEVYTTEDAGKSWIGTKIVATDACRPWIEFGANGVLGVVWRTHHVHCFAAVSLDHGASFSMPLRFNKEAQPLGDSGPTSDYWSRIEIDEEFVHVGWADCRTGGALSVIYGRAPLGAFKAMPPAPIPLTTRPGTPLPHKEEAM